MSERQYKEIALDAIPRDSKGNAAIDLYVFLPILKKYIIFVAEGGELTDHKLEQLSKHTIPKLFVEEGGADRAAEAGSEGALAETAQAEILGEKATKELRDVFHSLTDPNVEDHAETTKKVETMAENLVAALAPDVKDLRDRMIQNTKYLNLMNDSAAITTIAMLVAFANGFDSTRSYKDLANACLIMDLSLMEFDEPTIRSYYTDRASLPSPVLAKILEHPQKSYSVAAGKIKTINDAALQLILNHHELYNGKGYPKGTRSEMLFPLARVLSFAVDVFEQIKGSEMRGSPLTLNQAINTFVEEKVEPHARRHSKKLVDHVIQFILDDEKAKREA